jgi:hypothetical protein
VAVALSGSWRHDVPAADPHIAEAITTATPFLLMSHTAALSWRRARSVDGFTSSAAAHALHDAYRHAALDAAVHATRIADVVARLREDGIEPMLMKGTAASAAYAEPFCRPGGDIDLIVRPADRSRAATILAGEVALLRVDLRHDHLIENADVRGLFERGSQMRIGPAMVTVPSPEDHLRLLCRHALRHGVARPVWLCDVAAWTEARDDGFDWTIAMGPGPRGAEHLRIALGLAHRLVGMRVVRTPAADHPVPDWVASTVLRRWSDVRPPMQAWRTYRGFAARVRAIDERWPPDPLLLNLRNGRSLARRPTLLDQLSEAARRVASERRARIALR